MASFYFKQSINLQPSIKQINTTIYEDALDNICGKYVALALANLCQKSVAKCFGCGVPFKPNNAIPLAPVHIVFRGSVKKKVA